MTQGVVADFRARLPQLLAQALHQHRLRNAHLRLGRVAGNAHDGAAVSKIRRHFVQVIGRKHHQPTRQVHKHVKKRIGNAPFVKQRQQRRCVAAARLVNLVDKQYAGRASVCSRRLGQLARRGARAEHFGRGKAGEVALDERRAAKRSR